MNNNLYELSINLIDLTKVNCRTVDPCHVQHLMNEIKKGYSLPPINCRYNPINPSRYEVVSGQHRFTAYKNLGYETISSSLNEMTDNASYLQSIKENVGHQKLSLLEKDHIAYNLFTKYGATILEIGELLTVGTQKTIQDMIMRYHWLHPSFKSLYNNKTLKKEDANLLYTLKPEFQEQLYEEIKNAGIARKTRYSQFIKINPNVLHNEKYSQIKNINFVPIIEPVKKSIPNTFQKIKVLPLIIKPTLLVVKPPLGPPKLESLMTSIEVDDKKIDTNEIDDDVSLLIFASTHLYLTRAEIKKLGVCIKKETDPGLKIFFKLIETSH